MRLYKNGVFEKVIDTVDYNQESNIRCVGSDVYTIVNDEPGKQVRIHKNGEKVYALDYNQEVYIHYESGCVNPLWVTPAGDIYFTILENGSLSRLYRNGKILYSEPTTEGRSFQPFCVIE